METFPYRLERLTDDRLRDVQQLLAVVLKKKASLDYLRIKYDTRHTGHQYLSCIAYDGDKPIAFYGSVPQAFRDTEGNRCMGTHLSDCMTLASYQRRGLHTALGMQVYQWMQEEGVNFIYGFHSENTHRSSQKLGWKDWGRLRGYAVEAAVFPLEKVYRRLPVFAQWLAKQIRRALAPYAFPASEFPNSHADLGLTVDYSPDFYASKAFHPNYWLEIKGVRFWLGIERGVRVGDVQFESPAQFLEALEELRHICKRLGFHQLLFQTYAGSRLDLALAPHFQGFESWMVGYHETVPGVDFRAYRPNYGDQDSF